MIDKIGQLLFIGIRGKTLTQDEAEFIVKNNIGGVVLFARNLESPAQVHALCAQIQATRHKTRDKLPLFIGIDQEGGRVTRLKAPFTVWPPLAKIGELDSTSVAFKFALCMGLEMRAVGINTDFAPCVDVYTNPKNEVIGDRALSKDPEQVAKLASALVRGYIKSGIIPCAKHYPGHGNTLADSHTELPVEDSDLDRLRSVELVPFKKVFRARLDMVMTSHIKFPKIDPEWPVTLSKTFLKEILRKDLRYRGLIVTDDLDMQALTDHHSVGDIAVRSLQAGCDILLYCNKFDHPQIALDAIQKALKDQKISAQHIDESFHRVVALKKDMLTEPDPKPLKEADTIVGHADHIRLAEAIKSGSVPVDLI
ncbi:MAG TPA: beta-N-acetylhexosaminidase [Bdellovibrionales bacterium]|nr:beta-N-acetylhexosaminidase [Bdellovibrionales bacterium]